VLEILSVLLAVLDGGVDQLLVLLLLRRGEDQRGIGGRILGLVLVDGRKVAGVADDNLERLSVTGPISFNARSAAISPSAPVQNVVGILRFPRI